MNCFRRHFQHLRRRNRRGFTLVEVLMTLLLLGLLTLMLFTSFHTVSSSWEVGRKVIDATGHSDYLLDQLSVALRSAYYPGVGEKYGLIFTDDGDDEYARDTIEWTKVGAALIGEDAEFAEVPHRVRVTVVDPEEPQPGGFAVRAWRQDLQLDEFDPEVDTASLTLSPKVIGFNCRMLDPDTERTADDELNWIDEWTKTNTLPTALELTLWLEPPERGEDPIESKRIVELPMGVLSQNPSTGSSSTTTARQGTSTAVGGAGPSGTRGESIGVGGGGRPGNRPGGGRPGQMGPGGMGGGGRPGGGGGRPPSLEEELFRPGGGMPPPPAP